MNEKTTTEFKNTKKECKTISKECIRNDGELQKISTKSINQLQELGCSIVRLNATLLLLLPIGISYEDWCFLHKIVDGDNDD